jgi:hypothetical protein
VLAELHAGQVAVAEIGNPALSQTVALVTSTHHPPSVATRAVCRVIKELFNEMVSSGRWPARHR